MRYQSYLFVYFIGLVLLLAGCQTKPSSNADLASLTINTGSLTPTFNRTVTSYSLTVPNSTTDIIVTATLADNKAKMTINNVTVASSVASSPIALSIGLSTVTIVVIAEDGSSKTITIIVTRLPLSWTKQFGTSLEDVALSVVIDSSDNVIVVGYTKGNLEGTNAGDSDAFIRKYDENGNVVWTRQFGTNEFDSIGAITLDKSDNLIVVGLTFGALVGLNAGINDAFVRKYSSDGAILWTKQFGTSASEGATSVVVDSSNNILISGVTFGSFIGSNAGLSDTFIRKYSSSGNVMWTGQFGTSMQDNGHSIAIDKADNIVVTGQTFGSLIGSNAGSSDAFIRKFSSGGEVLWTKQFGTSDFDTAAAVEIDSLNNILIVGNTFGVLDGSNAGGDDAFIRKYNPAGDIIWTRQFGTSQGDEANSVAVDDTGNVVVVGETTGTFVGQNVGITDAFVRQYKSNGDIRWTKQFGTSGYDFINTVALDSSGNVLVSGDTEGAIVGSNFGGRDAFIQKIVP